METAKTPEVFTASKDAHIPDTKDSELPSEEIAPDNIAAHQKTLREQLMTQWPNNNWEIR